MNLYFDNAASCRPFEWAAELFQKTSLEYYANQEAAGELGSQARKLVEDASARLADALAPEAGVIWCNSGTEALSTVLRMHCLSHPGTEIITTRAEHPALKEALQHFAGISDTVVKYAEIDNTGAIKMDSIAALLSTKTSLLATHHVNAETGAIQDLAGIRGILDAANASKTFFLADTTQSAGKITIPWEQARLDFCTVSGCKIGSPCGAALLYRDTKDKFVSKRLGALRTHGHAVGRCVPAAAHTLSMVAEELSKSIDERADNIGKIRADILNFIRKNVMCKMQETIPTNHASPYILHLIFPNHQGAVLVRILASQKATIAAGSACMAETPSPSPTLTVMGYDKNSAFGAIRISFWDDTTLEDVEVFKNLFVFALKNY